MNVAFFFLLSGMVTVGWIDICWWNIHSLWRHKKGNTFTFSTLQQLKAYKKEWNFFFLVTKEKKRTERFFFFPSPFFFCLLLTSNPLILFIRSSRLHEAFIKIQRKVDFLILPLANLIFILISDLCSLSRSSSRK